jgi:peptidylprolyl isomerase
MRLRIARTLAALAIPAVLLTACGSGSADDSKPTGDPGIADVKVAGKAGQKPTVTVKAPFSVKATSTRVITAGKGPKVATGQSVNVHYVLVNGRDGKEIQTTYGQERAVFTADETKLFKGLVRGLTGQQVGSRVLVGIPPADAFGAQGNTQLGVQKDDTVLFVLDILSIPPAQATGAPVTPKAGLPTVTVDGKGEPTITLPKTKAPTTLVTQQLIKGTGPVVKSGQTVTAHYTGVVWPGGKLFDSSFKRGQPANFVIGVGRVVKGWDQSLVGQTVGSRVLLVIPPALGYGKNGQPEAGIKGTDTLVFVVDILDVGTDVLNAR